MVYALNIACICAIIGQALAVPPSVFPFGQSRETIDIVFNGHKYPNVQGKTPIPQSRTIRVSKKGFARSENPSKKREIFNYKESFLINSVTVPPGYTVNVRQPQCYEDTIRLYGTGWLASGTHNLEDTVIWNTIISTQRVKFLKNPPEIVEGMHTWPYYFQLREETGASNSAIEPETGEDSVMPEIIEGSFEPVMSGGAGASKKPGGLSTIPENGAELGSERGDGPVGVDERDRKTSAKESDTGVAIEEDGDTDGVKGNTDKTGVERSDLRNGVQGDHEVGAGGEDDNGVSVEGGVRACELIK